MTEIYLSEWSSINLRLEPLYAFLILKLVLLLDPNGHHPHHEHQYDQWRIFYVTPTIIESQLCLMMDNIILDSKISLNVYCNINTLPPTLNV